MTTIKNTALLLVLFLASLSSFACVPQQFSARKEMVEQKDSLAGVYVLDECENGRFKIQIEKSGTEYNYRILDKEKSIGKGKVRITKDGDVTYLTFGNIGSLWEDGSIIVQNYGNAMNEYNHFTQCDSKYLTFKKNK